MTKTFESAGPHIATLTVTDNCGASASATVGVDVNGVSSETIDVSKPSPSTGPVLVFVDGITGQQPEYSVHTGVAPNIHYSIRDHVCQTETTMTGDDHSWDDMIAALSPYYTIVKMPAQSDPRMRDDRLGQYKGHTQDPVGDLVANGHALQNYVRDNPRCKGRDVIFVTHSMGGLVARAMIDNCVSFHHGQPGFTYLDPWYRVKGVIQLGTPNLGVDGADLAKYIAPNMNPAAAQMDTTYMRDVFNHNNQNWGVLTSKGAVPFTKKRFIRFAGQAHGQGSLIDVNGEQQYYDVKRTDDDFIQMASVWGPDFLNTPWKQTPTSLTKRIDGDKWVLDWGIHVWSFPFYDMHALPTSAPESQTALIPANNYDSKIPHAGSMKNVFLRQIGTSIDRLANKNTVGRGDFPWLATTAGTADIVSPEGPDLTLGSREVTRVAFVAGQECTCSVAADGPMTVTLSPGDCNVVVAGPDGAAVPMQSTVSTWLAAVGGTDVVMSTLQVSLPTTDSANYTVVVSGGTPGPGSLTVRSEAGPYLLAMCSQADVQVGSSVVVTATVAMSGAAPVACTAMTARIGSAGVSLVDNGVPPDVAAGDGIYTGQLSAGGVVGTSTCEVVARYDIAPGVVENRADSIPLCLYASDVHINACPTVEMLPLSPAGVRDGYVVHVPVSNGASADEFLTSAVTVCDSSDAVVCRPSAEATVLAASSSSIDVTIPAIQLASALSTDSTLTIDGVDLSGTRNSRQTVLDHVAGSVSFPIAVNELCYRYCTAEVDSSNPGSSTVVTVTGEACSNDGPVTGVQCSWDEGATWLDAAPASGSFDSKSEAYTARFVLPEGQWTVRVRPITAGQPWEDDTWAEVTAIVDITAPSASDDATSAYRDAARVTISACDSSASGTAAPSGLSAIEWSLDDGNSTLESDVQYALDATVSVDTSATGAHTLKYRAIDQAGNASSWITRNFVVNATPFAVGGTKYTDGPYTVHVFTASDNLVVSGTITDATELVAAGGGGGGSGSGDRTGGGGGAGGLVYLGGQTISGTLGVVVGGGGASCQSGGNSSFNGQTAIGGSRGAHGYPGQAAGTGGSGGGAKHNGFGAGGGTSGQGHAGGTSGYDSGNGQSGSFLACGGGGYSGTGGNASWPNAGPGGSGIQLNTSGASEWYCAGGGGGAQDLGQGGCAGLAGTGGGGTGGLNSVGADATCSGGGGGGGGSWFAGGRGSQGIVIVRYLTPTD